MRLRLAQGLLALSTLFALLMAVFFVIGFPVPFLEGTPFKIKSLRKLFEIGFVLLALALALHPRRSGILSGLKEKAESLARAPWAPGALTAIYFLLFLWMQITKYLSLEINFIPFLFYDYMLWFFDQGKFCFTGFLHGFYHVNLALLLLYPAWKIFQNGWVLHIAHPLIAALAVLPFFYWAKEELKSPLRALTAAFVYLNYRFLQNLVMTGFSVEVFYPLFLFLALYFGSAGKNVSYLLSLSFGLLIKEDSAVYFGAMGLFFLLKQGHRVRGIVTLTLAAAYLIFVLNVLLPWTGSDILEGDLKNFHGLRGHPFRILTDLLSTPGVLVRELFLPPEKLKTLFKLTSKLLFLPLLSPVFLLAAIALFPIFFRGGDLFVELALYYGAPVLPFVFMAFVLGWKKFGAIPFLRSKPFVEWGIIILLIFLNGFNLRPLHFSRDNGATIRLARDLPKNTIVVTQGHLLPYVGYRKWNFYLAPHYETNAATREAYLNPDYYLFDFAANPYPLSRDKLYEKAADAKRDSGFEIAYEDEQRLLLKRRV